MPAFFYARKMAARSSVPVAALVRHLEKSKNPELLALARCARDAFGVESVDTVYAADPDKAVDLAGPADVARGIAGAIDAEKDWTASPAPKKLAILRKSHAVLERFLKESHPVEWTWVQLRLGGKEEARKTLLAAFEKESERVLKETEAVYGFRGGPLDEAELILRGLRATAAPAELPALEDKMQKMKVHVSNLPQSHIMT